MSSASEILKSMPTIEKLAQETQTATEEVEVKEAQETTEELTIEKLAESIVGAMVEDADLRSQVLAGLSEEFAPHLKEAAERAEVPVSEEDLEKIATECNAAGQFIAQGFIAAIERHAQETENEG